MSKKTKKQKILAQKRRLEMLQQQAKLKNTPPATTGTNQSIQVKNPQLKDNQLKPNNHGQDKSTKLIKKDLVKTIVIIFVLLIIELIIFYLK